MISPITWGIALPTRVISRVVCENQVPKKWGSHDHHKDNSSLKEVRHQDRVNNVGGMYYVVFVVCHQRCLLDITND